MASRLASPASCFLSLAGQPGPRGPTGRSQRPRSTQTPSSTAVPRGQGFHSPGGRRAPRPVPREVKSTSTLGRPEGAFPVSGTFFRNKPERFYTAQGTAPRAGPRVGSRVVETWMHGLLPWPAGAQASPGTAWLSVFLPTDPGPSGNLLSPMAHHPFAGRN